MLNKKIFRLIPIICIVAMFFFVVLTMLLANLPYNDTYYGGGRNMYELIAADDFDTDTVASLVMMILLVAVTLPIELIYNIVIIAQKKDSPFFCIFPMVDTFFCMIPFVMVMAIIDCDCAHSDSAIPMIITGFIAMLIAWVYLGYNILHFVLTLIAFIKEKNAARRAKTETIVEAQVE